MPVEVVSHCVFTCDFCNETATTGGAQPPGWLRWEFVAADFYSGTDYRPSLTACGKQHAMMALAGLLDRVRGFVGRHAEADAE